MTDRFWGVEFGGDKTSVVEGSSSTATLDVEVRVTYDATANNKNAVIVAMQLLIQKLQQAPWPPA